MMRQQVFDIIVAGAGPAGSAAAFHLARNGYSVCILEKENLPRHKICGGGIVFRALKEVFADITPATEQEYYSVSQVLPEKEAGFEVRRNFPLITMVMRDTFDDCLAKAAVEAGAEIMEGAGIENVGIKNKITVTTAVGEFRSRFLVAADGVHSRIAKACGWKETRTIIPALEAEIQADPELSGTHFRQPRFDIGATPDGYGWMFPKKKSLSVGVLSMKRTRTDLHSPFRHYTGLLGINDCDIIRKGGAVIPVSPRSDGLCRNNVFLTGDAAGLTDPVTAEGITNALLSGRIAAEALTEGKLDPARCAAIFEKRMKQEILAPLSVARRMAGLFYGRQWLRNIAFGKLGQALCEYIADIFSGDRNYDELTFRETAAIAGRLVRRGGARN
ncbi:MAG: NAD(P)/FAD-dependent oxidoreductase [Bacteroidetes bacterium]|nr:NAD(P)/FAD-dependent oxidoreductase [Bacteroidota bacterium]